MMRKFGNSNYFTYIASYFHTSKHKHYNIIKPYFEALSGQEESEELKITTKFRFFFLQLHRASWYYQVFIWSNGCTIKCSKKNVKIYIKINIKSAPTCFGLDNHHQGAWHLCFAKVIIIKIVS